MRDALLADVIAAPEDDRPRLVYADWLLEQGDPLGELIQLQCRITRAAEDGVPDDSTLRRVKLRAAKLKKLHAEAWEAPLRALGGLRWEWRRGFVEHIEADVGSLVAWGDRLLEAAPLVSSFTGAFATDGLDGFLAAPVVPRLRALSAAILDDAVLARLAASPALAGLQALELRGYRLAEDALVTLVDSPTLLRLRRLELAVCPEDLAPLGRAAWPLVSLVLHDPGRAPDPLRAQALATARVVRGLRRLVLHGLLLSADGWAVVVNSGALAGVVELEISSAGLTAADVDLLLDERKLPALRKLHLGGNPSLGDEGAARVAAHPGSRRLTKLHLGGCRVKSAGARALAASPHLAGLAWLILSDTKIDDEARQAFVASSTLKGKVWLRGRVLTPNGT